MLWLCGCAMLVLTRTCGSTSSSRPLLFPSVSFRVDRGHEPCQVAALTMPEEAWEQLSSNSALRSFAVRREMSNDVLSGKLKTYPQAQNLKFEIPVKMTKRRLMGSAVLLRKTSAAPSHLSRKHKTPALTESTYAKRPCASPPCRQASPPSVMSRFVGTCWKSRFRKDPDRDQG